MSCPNPTSLSSSDKDCKPQKQKRETGFEEWGGYLAAKRMKLNAQFNENKPLETDGEDSNTSEIFKGITIYVNGYTNPPADELKRLMMIHGGAFDYHHSSKTTHTIATSLPNSKFKNLKTQIVVTADWIIDSVKEKKLLSHQKYLLYSEEKIHKQNTLTKFIKATAESTLQHNCAKSLSSVFPHEHHQSDHYEERSDDNSKNDSLPVSDSILHNTDQSVTNNEHDSSLSKFSSAVKAGQPDFMSEFYRNSRLHHISTAGQELKQYVRHLIESNKDKTFVGREKLQNMCTVSETMSEFLSDSWKKNRKVIMHLDMDCFFVSVGLRKYPELKGQPVAVAHSKGKRGGPQTGSDITYEANYYRSQSEEKICWFELNNGETLVEPVQTPKISKHSKEYGSLSEIASCSYEARKAGLKNGMFLGEAMRRCPGLKTIPYDFEGYSEVSKILYDVVSSYTLDIEAVSCDELFIDCTALINEIKIDPNQFAATLRSEILEKTSCTASAGMGCNKLIARLANKVAKPNGQHYVSDSDIESFMKKQILKDLPGVGYSTSSRFKSLGLATCEDLQGWTLSKLQSEFGPKTGQSLFDHCRGKDSRAIETQKDRKSVSAEINYGIRFETEEDIYNFINELASEVQKRLQNINCKGKSITLKLMVRKQDAPVETAKFMGHGVCDNVSKSTILKCATDSSKIISSECCMLARSLKIFPQDYRGVGIQINKLEPIQKVESKHNTITKFIGENSHSKNPLNDGVPSPKQKDIASLPASAKGTVKEFLENKSMPARKATFNVSDYIPTELDEDILKDLPEDIQKELIANRAAMTSSATSASNTTRNLTDESNSPKNADASLNENSNEAASLAGAVDINEIRGLIKEWTQSTEYPLDVDIEDIQKFFSAAVREDLQKVSILLKHFYRLANSCNQKWKLAYQTVLSFVQEKVFESYGTILEMESDFT